jgi:hypothetical protein
MEHEARPTPVLVTQEVIPVRIILVNVVAVCEFLERYQLAVANIDT